MGVGIRVYIKINIDIHSLVRVIWNGVSNVSRVVVNIEFTLFLREVFKNQLVSNPMA